jgi:polyphosphate glucokinase
MKEAESTLVPAPQTAKPATILSVDVGGTGIKGALVSYEGQFITERVRVKTPEITKPDDLLTVFAQLVDHIPKKFDVISVGFPGVLRRGIIRTCPTLKTDVLLGVNLEEILSKKFKVPVRGLNDAEMQALPAIYGKGIELVITLGTGFGFALFEEGRLGPHLEMSTHFTHNDKTHNAYVGDAALEKHGYGKWRERVSTVIADLKRLTDFDRIYIGGGNARHLSVPDLPKEAEIISNDLGIQGGAYLWHDERWTHMKHWHPLTA